MQPARRSGRQWPPLGRVGPCGSRSTAPAGSAAISGDGWPRPAPTSTSSHAAPTCRPCASTACGCAASRGTSRSGSRPPRPGLGRPVQLRAVLRQGVRHSGGPTSITFGELNGQVTDRAQRLLDCCQRAGFAAELSPSIKTVLWAKLAFICAQAGMTAAVRLPIGEIRMVDAAWAAFQRLVAEVAAVAEADGTPVPPAAQERALAMAQSVEPGSFSSLHDDLVAGRRMELEALHGFVVRRAAGHGVPVSMSEAIYAILKPWAVRNERTGR